jgi:hypothetical protein
MKRGLDLVSKGASLRSGTSFGLGFLGESFFGERSSGNTLRISRRCANRNLDSDLASSKLLALEDLYGFLLLLLVTYIDESVAFAASGLTEPPPDNASRDNVDTSRGKKLSEGGIIYIEGEIGDEDDRLGGFTSGSFTLGARRLGGTRTSSRFLRSSFALSGRSGFLSRDRGRGRSISFAVRNCFLGARFALKIRRMDERNTVQTSSKGVKD